MKIMLVSFDKVAFGYGDNLIFGGAAFSINEGERTALRPHSNLPSKVLTPRPMGKYEI